MMDLKVTANIAAACDGKPHSYYPNAPIHEGVRVSVTNMAVYHSHLGRQGKTPCAGRGGPGLSWLTRAWHATSTGLSSLSDIVQPCTMGTPSMTHITGEW